jgi:hypothetical protein
VNASTQETLKWIVRIGWLHRKLLRGYPLRHDLKVALTQILDFPIVSHRRADLSGPFGVTLE